jgi:hypothetical protein
MGKPQIEESLTIQKERINSILNEIYNDISKEAFELDGHRIPYHGIKYPDKENPINLF